MKTVTAVLMVYAILVIASSIFWVSFALSNPSLTARNNKAYINLATNPDKMKQDAKVVTDKVTELAGGVTDDAKADGQVNDIVKSNDL